MKCPKCGAELQGEKMWKPDHVCHNCGTKLHLGWDEDGGGNGWLYEVVLWEEVYPEKK